MKKILAIALGAALTTTAATAGTGGYIALTAQQDSGSVIQLDTVVSDTAGKLAIYDYRSGEMGAKLGETAVHEGVNSNLKVGVGPNLQGDVLAVLVNANGKKVATRHIDVRD